MSAIQIAIRIHHLGFNPQPEIHAQMIHIFDEAVQSVRKLLRIHDPVTKPGLGVVSFAEPSVIDDKELNADLGRLISELFLPSLAHVELCRFP